MQSIHIFLDIAKFADFQWKVADVSRTQGVRHVIYMFFGFFLREGITVPSFITVEYLWQILGRGGELSATPLPWAAPKKPILNRVNAFIPKIVADCPDWGFKKETQFCSVNTFLYSSFFLNLHGPEIFSVHAKLYY